MLFQLSLATSRRALVPSLVARSLLTRSISSSHVFFAQQKTVKAGTTAGASKTKSSAATKANAKDNTKTKTKDSTKTKAKAKPKSRAKPKVTKPKPKKAAEGPKVPKSKMKVPPRPGISPWAIYIGQTMKGVPAPRIGRVEQFKEYAQKWKAMSEEEKAPFIKLADEAKVARAKQWDEWLASVRPEVLRAINKKRKKTGVSRIVPLRSNYPPVNSFIRFRNVFRSEHPELNPWKELTEAASAAWHKLPEDQKQVYRDEYKQERDIWRAEQAKSA